jgi:hypothetical protein
MKNTFKVACFALMLVLGFSTTTCSGSGGGDSGDNVKNAKELKKYLDSQPANTIDEPIKVAGTPKFAIRNIAETISASGKYVSLDLSGSVLKTIPEDAFKGCKGLVTIIIPDSVKSIGISAFSRCTSLKSVTIGNGVKTLGDNAFFECTSLTNVTIPDKRKMTHFTQLQS